MSELIKRTSFQRNPKARQAFEEIMNKIDQAQALALPCFEVECDGKGVGIGGVLTQEGKPLTYFSEKLCDSKRKHSIYDKEFYTILKRPTNGATISLFKS